MPPLWVDLLEATTAVIGGVVFGAALFLMWL